MQKIIILLSISLLALSCNPKVSSSLAATKYPALKETDKIVVLEVGETLAAKATFIGDLKIGDSGFSNNCGYAVVKERAEQTARQSGANLVQITQIKKPNMGSTCYRIKAKMYRIDDEMQFAGLLEKIADKNKSRLPADADYAVIYFYRPSNFSGAAIGYKIRIEDSSIIGRVRNGEKFAYTTKDFGKHKF